MTATVHSHYTQTVDRRYSASRLNQFSSSEHSLQNNTFGTLHCELKSPQWVCASLAMRTLPVVSTHCLMVSRTKVPSWERMFQGMN